MKRILLATLLTLTTTAFAQPTREYVLTDIARYPNTNTTIYYRLDVNSINYEHGDPIYNVQVIHDLGDRLEVASAVKQMSCGLEGNYKYFITTYRRIKGEKVVWMKTSEETQFFPANPNTKNEFDMICKGKTK